MIWKKQCLVILALYLQSIVFADKLDEICADSKKKNDCNEKEHSDQAKGVIPARPRQHPYVASIGFGDSEDSVKWYCGGSLISDRWVLTVAHCTQDRTFGTPKWVKVGDLDLNSTADDARPQLKKVMEVILHPDYKKSVFYNDVALLKLDSPLVFDEYVSPICLHTSEQIPVQKATITGWGNVKTGGELSSHLRQVDLPLVSHTQCSTAYQNLSARGLARGIDEALMLCAGEEQGGEELCQGISGAPLTIPREGACSRSQIGISSFARGCGLPKYPGVYNRVSAYVPWIKSVVL